ncbi:MAG: sigma 54-interacting transcriptional regulator [Polyangiaceae bacterium]|nr:sigma 54-interacting transcriptional regulator [Polyangiaceae bacterium]
MPARALAPSPEPERIHRLAGMPPLCDAPTPPNNVGGHVVELTALKAKRPHGASERSSVGEVTTVSDDPVGAADERLDHRLVVRWLVPEEHDWPLEGAVCELLGRGEDCSRILPGSGVSRRHAELRCDGSELVIRDLSSRNGTWVDGQRIIESALGDGALLRIGDWVGIVRHLRSKTEGVGASAFPREDRSGPYWGKVLRPILDQLHAVSRTTLPILIAGETGTGKECVARAVHEWSGRKGPIVALNCASIPEALAEAELFGFRKGSFTGADQSAPGYFVEADGGTLLLDEVSELSPSIQAKLLRVLQEGTVFPLGTPRGRSVDVRVLAAAHRPLHEHVARGRFRSDLYCRLNGYSVLLPALRERVEEVPALFQHLLSKHSAGYAPSVHATAVEYLCTRDWPGNVRQLELLARRILVLLGTRDTITREDLERCLQEDPASAAAEVPATMSSSRPEVQQLLHALAAHRGNVVRAAAALGISRHRVYRLLAAEPNINLDAFRR